MGYFKSGRAIHFYNRKAYMPIEFRVKTLPHL